ncbi:MFS transporter [Curtobacterium sp. BRB10]|uniref:MFS transporter n=1 Tax=Curtobacterium sp. BRB10 TaxID=2962579 RepID=UPI002880CDA8|nr:MFS transporter [Curtobacterium sp. BRB10]MDT0234853.1 MFS transporter [Curtobacterium sp. BRB10]
MSQAVPTSTTPADPDGPDAGPRQREKLGALGVLLFQANFGWMLATGVSGTLLPALMEQVDADAKVALYGTLTSIGAVAGLVANIVFGSLSDRTRSRFGRRNPWILGGGLVATLALSAMSLVSAFPLLVLLYVVFQVGLNALLAPLAAVLPDRVAPARRGVASAFIGFGTLLAQSLGSVVGAAFLSNIRVGLGLVPFVLALTTILFVVFARDSSTRHEPKRTLTFREILVTFRVPMDRDYLLALFGRLVLLLAFYCVVLYQYFVLQDYVGLDAAGVAGTVALSGIVLAVASGIGTLVSGPLSDWIKRRKLLVVIASLIIAAAFVPLILWPSTGTFLGFIGAAGLAYGVYIAVDQALMSDVLPSDAEHGKDMGILNIANTAPQFIAPGLAGIALGTGIGYGGLFTVGAVLAVLSAVLIGSIRRVH